MVDTEFLQQFDKLSTLIKEIENEMSTRYVPQDMKDLIQKFIDNHYKVVEWIEANKNGKLSDKDLSERLRNTSEKFPVSDFCNKIKNIYESTS